MSGAARRPWLMLVPPSTFRSVGAASGAVLQIRSSDLLSLVQRRTGNADTFAIGQIVDPLLAEITHIDLGLSASSLPAFRWRVRRAVRL